MAIPKIIYQTYKNNQLPLMARIMTSWLKLLNPEYQYEFYDDERILAFIQKSYPSNVLQAYSKLDIGAAKADFFRYLVLNQNGGVYLDLDAYFTKPLKKYVKSSDNAIITKERNPGIFAQYALIFSSHHPILEKCISIICDNIDHKKHINDIHKLTGPSVFTDAVNWYLKEYNTDNNTRILGIDYNGYIKPKYWLHSGIFAKREKWQKAQQNRPAVKD